MLVWVYHLFTKAISLPSALSHWELMALTFDTLYEHSSLCFKFITEQMLAKMLFNVTFASYSVVFIAPLLAMFLFQISKP